jgi:hypothetical protein
MDSPPSEVSPDNVSGHGRNQGHHKKRVRAWTEDDRAKHRVFEKGRREAFSDSLLVSDTSYEPESSWLRYIQALARFLPSLASVKESKLSKHTIVDESLKYHEVQKTKLEDLQKAVDDLQAEKEALLAELSGWRDCLNTEPTAQAELLEAATVRNDGNQIANHDLMQIYDSTAVLGPSASIGMPAIPSAGYDILAEPILHPMPDAQMLNNYALHTSRVSFSNNAGFGALPRVSQYPVQGETRGEPPQHDLWGANVQQPLWTQSSHQELPLEFQQHRF